EPPAAAKPAVTASSRSEPAKAEPKPLPQGPNKLVFCRGLHLTLIDPDGKNEKTALKTDVYLDSEDYCLSPDGKCVAVSYPEKPDGPAKKILIRELGKDGPWTDLGPGSRVFWSGDGTQLLLAVSPDGAPGNSLERSHHLVNPATKARTEVKLP